MSEHSKYSSYARLALRRCRRPARGFRLSPTRISVRRLRAKLCTLLGLLGRYLRNVRLLKRGLVVAAGGSRSRSALQVSGAAGSGSRRKAAAPHAEAGRNGKAAPPRRPPCVRSNSFYARAVAECLEFIKGSNVPLPREASPLRPHATPRRSGR